jgi:hypothetical protein
MPAPQRHEHGPTLGNACLTKILFSQLPYQRAPSSFRKLDMSLSFNLDRDIEAGLVVHARPM